jgi:hypothetical protein
MHNVHFEKALFRELTVNKGIEKNDTYSYTGNYNKERSGSVNLIHVFNNLGQGKEWTLIYVSLVSGS